MLDPCRNEFCKPSWLMEAPKLMLPQGPGDGPLELRETHISWVFLTATEAYKIKKPLALGFLDYRTPELRKQACLAEVRLNRRLEPEVYIGVEPLTQPKDGSTGGPIELAGPGCIVDWAVHMRRIPDCFRGDVRLEKGQLGGAQVDALASRLVRFHAGCREDAETRSFGTVEKIGFNVRENFEPLRGDLEDHLTLAPARELEHRQLAFLEKHAGLFETRIAAGRVRDGHGDLRLEQLYIDDADRITILDCVEFNDRFRFADVCADLAFLSMDLCFHGRGDLAERLLASYARESGDYDLYRLVDFYASYRATVRAKVALFRGRPPDLISARQYLLLALSATFPRRELPLLVATCGLPASGKSTLAEGLSAQLGAPVLGSDWTRKWLAGVPPTQSLATAPWTAAYHPDATARVYAELFRRARILLESGRSVILDATFPTQAMRRAARSLAQSVGVPFRLLECQVPLEVCRERLRMRESEPSVSDARSGILDEFRSSFEPLSFTSMLPSSESLVIKARRCWAGTVVSSLMKKRTSPPWRSFGWRSRTGRR